MNKRRRAISLPRLLARHPHAITVYAAVRWLAGDRRQISPTRSQIADVCYRSERLVGAALGALHEAGWIRLNYGRDGKRTWYRISFPVVGFWPVVSKTAHRDRARMSKNDTQRSRPCGTRNIPPSPIGEEGGPSAGPPRPRRARGPRSAGIPKAPPAPEPEDTLTDDDTDTVEVADLVREAVGGFIDE